MDRTPPAQPALVEPPRDTTRTPPREVRMPSIPVLAEQFLHMLVGFNDTYLANHLVRNTSGLSPAAQKDALAQMAAAAAAVGTISYILWLIGLLTAAIGTGSTAIIARATGARH